MSPKNVLKGRSKSRHQFMKGSGGRLAEDRIEATELFGKWSEPLQVDNELSNINSWREKYEKDEAALRPCIQDIGSSRT